ncbi:MAG: hypothetical protein FVQ85_06765 [Planctomycetes bacterium]|nr:hypothetical protein [Planctomycetota bacterium]
MDEPDAKSATLYALSTVDLTLVHSINNMGHITDITEDPITGSVWVTGFTMPQYVSYLPATGWKPVGQTPVLNGCGKYFKSNCNTY